jgi:hypothetical protein
MKLGERPLQRRRGETEEVRAPPEERGEESASSLLRYAI